ncbi:hypothetical protein BDP27DRAFT_1034462 [Rhodocollybia butyracea]|uniref:Uncharacterized protein n=1 Tax=Rhodocollybia butyracea TaxID=206335 RepID=A0A9P5Q637_9AGAR|nr:hypothetical protein BDP27DRAFT_1034462 [Rhodocollybia butyracea]
MIMSQALVLLATFVFLNPECQTFLDTLKFLGAGLSFQSSVPDGALLILPEGGSKIDHHQYTKFYEYAAESARTWYAHVNGPLARGVHSGSLYLVTGCDKARAWGVASFTNANPREVSLEFMPCEPRVPGAPEYLFSTCSSAFSSSDADNIFKNESGCVFLRGFKIAIRARPFIPGLPVKVTYTSNLEVDELLPKPKGTGHAKMERRYKLAPRVPSNTSTTFQTRRPAEDPGSGNETPNFDPPAKYQACYLKHRTGSHILTHCDCHEGTPPPDAINPRTFIRE